MSIIDNLALMMVPIIVVILAVYSIGGIGILVHYLIERYKKRKEKKDLDNTICPICGKGILVKKHIVEVFEYEDNVVTIPDYIVYECMICGEAIVDSETLKTSGEIIREMYEK